MNWDGQKLIETGRVFEWELQLPENMVVRTEAYYDTVYEHGVSTSWKFWRRFADGGSQITILSAIDRTGNVVPLDRSRKAAGELEDFTISIGNGDGLGQRFPVDYCITVDQRKAPTGVGCRPENKNCMIYASYFGWPLDVGVPRNSFYREPQKVCKVLRDTLRGWTTKIDSLIVNNSK